MQRQGQIEFRRSGHFWTDLGVIALWHRLADAAPNGVRCEGDGYVAEHGKFKALLRANALELSGQEEAILSELRVAVEALRAQVWQPTKKGKMWWFGIADFLYAGQWTIDFLRYYDQIGAKLKKPPAKPCSICGRDDLPVRITATAYNPLTVSVDKMSTFYSELSGGETICQACAFASPFALTRAWYSIQELTATLVWPVGPDFLALNRFFQTVSRHFIVAHPFRNYQQAIQRAQSASACFLDVLCSLWNVSQNEGSGHVLAMALAGVQFHAMQLSKPNRRSNVISVDRYEIIPDPVGILRLVQTCDQTSRQGERWNALQSSLSAMPIIRQTPEGRTEADTRLLDATSRAVVARAPVDQVIEERVYAALDDMQRDAASIAYFPTVGLRTFIPIYLEEVKDMTVDLLPSVQSVGTTLGELVKQTDDRSILYNLRNARNPDDLLEVLSRVVIRHADEFIAGEPELYRGNVRKLAESIDQTNWRRIRSLLGIYAGLRFIDLSKPQSGQQSSQSAP